MARAKKQSGLKQKRAEAKAAAKKTAAGRASIMAAPKLFARACGVLKNHWKLFLALLTAYVTAYVLLVGVSNGALSAAKAALDLQHTSGLSAGSSLLSTLLNSPSTNSNTAAGVYQTMLLLIMSLVLIWTLRQLHAARTVRARDAFYQGSAPLIPFLLVMIVVGLELLPLIAAGAFYNVVVNNGVVVGAFEKAIVLVICIALAAVSVYLLCSSVFALYIVTEPEAAPMQSLRRARDLVRFRRFEILRKLLFLPLALIIAATIIMMPIALYLTSIATFAFLVLTTLVLAVAHSYMYTLYRELS